MKNYFKVYLSLMLMVVMMVAISVTAYAGTTSTKQVVMVKAASASKGKAVKLTWNKVDKATKYVVYGQNNSTKKYKKLATVNKSKRSYTVKKIDGTNLSKNKVYKFYVVAYNKNKKIVKSNEIKFITNNTFGKYANANSIKVNKKELTLEVGKTEKLKVTTKIYKDKKHLPKKYGAATRYVSDNSKVAKVSSKGVITAVAAGSATIYIQDLGGQYCTVKVTVKKSDNPKPTPTTIPDPTYTVTFDMMGHGILKTEPIKGIKPGSSISKPGGPYDDDYAFLGWYKDSEYKSEWDFAKDTVTKDITLYAKWTANSLKAVYRDSDKSLTFYYDAIDYSNDGVVYEGDTGEHYLFDESKEGSEKWGYNGIREEIKKVELDQYVQNYKGFVSTAYMFSGMCNVTALNGETSIKTDNVTDMSHMFESFGSNVEDLMFAPSVEDWNVENVKDMSSMFYSYGASSNMLIQVPNVTDWKVEKVTDISYMFFEYGFNYCEKFELDLSKWDLKSITKAVNVFLKAGNSCSDDNWLVTIPAMTNGEMNSESEWYLNDSIYVTPAEGKEFTPMKVISSIMPRLENEEKWYTDDSWKHFCYSGSNTSDSLKFGHRIEGTYDDIVDVEIPSTETVTKSDDNYVYSKDGVTITFVMNGDAVKSVKFDNGSGTYGLLNGEYKAFY